MSLLRRISFNFWYFRRPPWDSGISPPELFDFISKHPAGRAIDLGCGTGTNVITLAHHGWQVTGIDFAPRGIQKARQKIKSANITADLYVGDVTQLNGISGLFDLALDMGCFHGVEKKAGYLTQLNRVLTSNGYWLLYAIFKTSAARMGLVASDVDLIQAHGFSLLWRKDGMDRRERPSAWFLFQKK